MTIVWFLCALAPGFLHALSSLADQYVIREHTSDSPLLFLSFSGFVCFPIALLIYPFIPATDPFDLTQGLKVMGIAWLFSACCIPYVYAMADADAHEFTPVFQTAPIFVALFAWVLFGETLTISQILGGLIVILASASSMMNWRQFHFQRRPFFLIVLAMILYACFVVALRAVASDLSWITISFWSCLGWVALPIIIMILSQKIRHEVRTKIQDTKGKILGYTAIQEIADVAANTSRTAALGVALVPAAITDIMGSFQVVFVLFLSYIAAKLVPSVYSFSLTRREVSYKLGCFALMLAGLWLLTAP